MRRLPFEINRVWRTTALLFGLLILWPLFAAEGLYGQVSITTLSPLPTATVGVAYSQTMVANGGTPGYTWSLVTGSFLPAPLTLSPAGVLSGIPANPGSFSFMIRVADSRTPVPLTMEKPFVLIVEPPPPSITTATPLPVGAVGTPYSQTLAAAGGTPGYSWQLVAGASLPGGLNLSIGGVLSGTPSAPGSFSFAIRVTDSSMPPDTAQKTFALTINPPISISTAAALPAGIVGTAYSPLTLSASGGIPAYTWSVVSGSSLPGGLNLSSAGVLSGTPSAAGSFSFAIRATDSGTPAQTAQRTFTLTTIPALVISTASPLPAGTTGTAYSQALAATGGVQGQGYVWSLVSGSSLPGGLNLSNGGVLSGTPPSSAAGSFNFTIRVTDNGTPAQTVQKPFALTISAPLSISTAASLPTGTVGTAYSQTLAASGGISPYAWSIVSGSSLPAGLTLSNAGLLSGTPTADGAFTFSLQVGDSSTPVKTAQRAFTLTINPEPLLITTGSPLPGGAVGTAYSQTMTASGGKPGYTWTVVAGSFLPAGLNLSGAGALSGTPSAPGAFTFTVQVTDSNTPARTAQKVFSLTISAGPPSITTGSPLPAGTVGIAYAQTLAASGGAPGYTWSLVAGSSLPSGLNLSASGVLSGTPIAAGSFGFTIGVTDSSASAQTAQKAFNLTINPGQPSITTASPLPIGAVGVTYVQAMSASGGTPGYSWSVVAGSFLPPGLTLSGTGLLSGTPSVAGAFTFTIGVTDSGTPGQTAQKTFNLTISSGPVPLSITTASPLPAGAVGTDYSQTLAVSGGTPGYTWSVAEDSPLPAGLILSSAGVLGGTPTASGSYSFIIRVTDSSSTPQTAQKTFALTISFSSEPLTVTSASPLPAGIVGTAYSRALTASGAMPPYTWFVVAGSSLPPGLTLSAIGVLSGTPAVSGVFSFTLLVADSGAPGQTAQKTFELSIAPTPQMTITNASPLPTGNVATAYSQTLTVNGGVPGYVWTVLAGSVLPPGLSLSAAGVLTGTPATAGSFSFTIGVTDSSIPAQTANKGFTLLIDPQSLPSFTLNNVPSEVNPTEQLGIGVALSAPYPASLSGTLRLSFVSRAVVPLDDPMVLFSTGSRTVGFTVPANGTAAVFPAPVLVLTGTVAGTITLTADMPGRPSQQVGTVEIRARTPQINAVAAARTTEGLRVQVTAYSTERRVQRVEFAFRVRTGTAVQEVKLMRDVEPEFETWYRNAASSTFGSSFVLTQSFAVQGNSTAIESVTVTLTNGQGSTTSGVAPFTN